MKEVNPSSQSKTSQFFPKQKSFFPKLDYPVFLFFPLFLGPRGLHCCDECSYQGEAEGEHFPLWDASSYPFLFGGPGRWGHCLSRSGTKVKGCCKDTYHLNPRGIVEITLFSSWIPGRELQSSFPGDRWIVEQMLFLWSGGSSGAEGEALIPTPTPHWPCLSKWLLIPLLSNRFG